MAVGNEAIGETNVGIVSAARIPPAERGRCATRRSARGDRRPCSPSDVLNTELRQRRSMATGVHEVFLVASAPCPVEGRGEAFCMNARLFAAKPRESSNRFAAISASSRHS